MEKNAKPQADMDFEVSWEVCNKVGGIFTVLSSKARQMQKYYKDRYFLIGPYFIESNRSTFKEEAVPEQYKRIYEELKEQEIICHFGTWLVEGEPKVILIDFKSFWPQINRIKKEMWDAFKIDSMNSPHDFDEPVLWSWAAGMLIEKMSMVHADRKIIVQVHEWLCGPVILYIKKAGLKIPTVFTTHATTLGRTLAGHGIDLYSVLEKVNPDDEAYKYGVQAKHNLERTTAAVADIFTTVSQITALEAKHLLKRNVDIVLPNGLDMSKFPSFEEAAFKHKTYRNKLREFALYYFFPYYTMDLKNTIFFFTASRYEFHNKGLDIFIESLGKLNERMKAEKSKTTVVTFFWVPTAVNNIKPEVAEAREAYWDIRDLLEEEDDDLKESLLYAITSEDKIGEKSLFNESFLLELKRKLLRLKCRKGMNAPLSTHNLSNPDNDPTLKAFREAGLANSAEDKVKVVFYPIYLSGADGLSDLDYYQSIQACHLGVFPSYYEPWGYTPLETAALGVASLTSNLSGFGKYFFDTLDNKKVPGIYILDIENQKKEEIMNNFIEILYRYSQFSRKARIDNKIQALKVALMADWENFVTYYIEAHNMAIEKCK